MILCKDLEKFLIQQYGFSIIFQFPFDGLSVFGIKYL